MAWEMLNTRQKSNHNTINWARKQENSTHMKAADVIGNSSIIKSMNMEKRSTEKVLMHASREDKT